MCTYTTNTSQDLTQEAQPHFRTKASREINLPRCFQRHRYANMIKTKNYLRPFASLDLNPCQMASMFAHRAGR